MVFEKIQHESYEQIIYCNDPGVGLKAIIAVHSTALGPAVGGCRMWAYRNEEEALVDVLRLSKGMTYKAAISNLKWGGGKAVLIGDAKTAKTPEMLRRFGEYVDRLGGCYVTAKDVGMHAEDLREIKSRTPHVLGIDGEPGSSGDPSPATAWGVYHGIRASAKFALGASSLRGMRVAVQGLGSVADTLIGHLLADGATVVGCDIDPAAIQRVTRKHGIETVAPDTIYDVACDIFAPCALGASINTKTLPRLQAKIVAGAANNQLATLADGEALMRRGMTYAPDYAINAGGLINIYHETHGEGYDKRRAFDQCESIGATIFEVLERAQAEKQTPAVVADRIAEERVARSSKNQKIPPQLAFRAPRVSGAR